MIVGKEVTRRVPISSQLRSVSLWFHNIARADVESARHQLLDLTDAIDHHSRDLEQWSRVLGADANDFSVTLASSIAFVASALQEMPLRSICRTLQSNNRTDTARAGEQLPGVAQMLDQQASELFRYSEDLRDRGYNVAAPSIALIAGSLGVTTAQK